MENPSHFSSVVRGDAAAACLAVLSVSGLESIHHPCSECSAAGAGATHKRDSRVADDVLAPWRLAALRLAAGGKGSTHNNVVGAVASQPKVSLTSFPARGRAATVSKGLFLSSHTVAFSHAL
jgi:hypothetical protein